MNSTWGIPNDILAVLAIDAVLIGLRLSGSFSSKQFIGAKVLGTGTLIGLHLPLLLA